MTSASQDEILSLRTMIARLENKVSNVVCLQTDWRDSWSVCGEGGWREVNFSEVLFIIICSVASCSFITPVILDRSEEPKVM